MRDDPVECRRLGVEVSGTPEPGSGGVGVSDPLLGKRTDGSLRPLFGVGYGRYGSWYGSL